MLAHCLHNIYHDGWMNIASRRFLHNIATEENPKSGLCPTLLEWLQWFFIVHSTIDSTTHFEQFGALYMHILDEKQPIRPGFEPSTPGFRAATGLIEPSVERVYTHLSTRKTLTQCCVNVGPRSWPKIKTTLGIFSRLLGYNANNVHNPDDEFVHTHHINSYLPISLEILYAPLSSHQVRACHTVSQQTRDNGPMLGEYCASVADSGPTFTRHWAIVFHTKWCALFTFEFVNPSSLPW